MSVGAAVAFFSAAALAVASIAVSHRRSRPRLHGGSPKSTVQPPPPTSVAVAAADRLSRCVSLESHGPLIIGVAGPSGSGKTTVCDRIVSSLARYGASVAVLSSDCYYHGLDGADPASYNFDEPRALDLDLLADHLSLLKAGRAVRVPKYDFSHHCRLEDQWTDVSGSDVIIVEGILIFAHERLADSFDLRVFTTEDEDVCLIRRLRRDIVHRGRTVDSVLSQYERFVKPSMVKFIRPSIERADILIPRAAENEVAIRLVMREIAARMPTLTGRGGLPPLSVLDSAPADFSSASPRASGPLPIGSAVSDDQLAATTGGS